MMAAMIELRLSMWVSDPGFVCDSCGCHQIIVHGSVQGSAVAQVSPEGLHPGPRSEGLKNAEAARASLIINNEEIDSPYLTT